MITKVDNPAKAESKDYTNKGSSSRLMNYLTGNAEKIDKEDLFFNSTVENISKKEVMQQLDTNVKGLKDTDHKFFSISINPSQDELKAIGNDKAKFKEFVKATMSNYAKAFKDMDIGEGNLIWAGIIHEKRFYIELDEYRFKKKNGEEAAIPFKAGQAKPGFQMHAHILVSARDSKMEKYLTVLTPTNKISRKFGLKHWQMLNAKTFQEIFNFRLLVNIYHEQQRGYYTKVLNDLEKLNLSDLDIKEALRVGERMNFSKEYSTNFKNLVRDVRNNQVIYNIENYLKNGREEYAWELDEKLPGLKENMEPGSIQQLEDFIYTLQQGRNVTVNDKTHLEDLRRKRKRKG